MIKSEATRAHAAYAAVEPLERKPTVPVRRQRTSEAGPNSRKALPAVTGAEGRIAGRTVRCASHRMNAATVREHGDGDIEGGSSEARGANSSTGALRFRSREWLWTPGDLPHPTKLRERARVRKKRGAHVVHVRAPLRRAAIDRGDSLRVSARHEQSGQVGS